ncbi:VanZ family protein [[Clostridium] dakarense]|uniref:VanZ family protein n=1 Tax=Faecalimicrobium dakarense TaxID=1301100 RepID=UPI0004AC7123|nr:VanZ family protein [[Clostridium] dakarense]
MKKISIVLVILWMGVIFYFSNQPAIVSTTQSDKVIHVLDKISEDSVLGNILHVLYESKGASFIIRKSAHMISYAILAVLSFIMIYAHKSYIRKSFIYGFLITLLYAITDEIHQLFIPGRAGMIQDVLIDSLGAIIGLSFNYINI